MDWWNKINMPTHHPHLPIDLMVFVYNMKPVPKPDSMFSQSELLEIQRKYQDRLQLAYDWGKEIKDVLMVKGLQDNSFEMLENGLKEKGFL